MLAEIFLLRLETQLRAARDAAQAETSRFVPLPVAKLPEKLK
ncbi:MAG TPA: hypothetical protein VKG24_00525 [Pseudolabrys sp.]|nr:hypothetical protein [Pseudolabrys sp.]